MVRGVYAILLFGTLAVLPPIDAVYCPDGCTDMDSAACAWHGVVTASHAACSLCLNAVAVHATMTRVDPPAELIATVAQPPSTFVSIPLRSVDRPPRS